MSRKQMLVAYPLAIALGWVIAVKWGWAGIIGIWMTAGILGLAGALLVHKSGQWQDEMYNPFPPLHITIIDGFVVLKVHPIRCRQTWWRRRYVACSVAMRFDGSDAVTWHSRIRDTWSDAVWEARSHLLRMVWVERGMSPWEGGQA